MESFKTTFTFDRVIHNHPLDVPSLNVPSSKKVNWEDNFEEGLKLQREDNLFKAEQSLSKALKILSALPNSSHFNEEKAKCFHAMAEIYFTRASKQSDDSSFCEMMVKSVALFEAERIYKYESYQEDKEINAAIFEAEEKLVDKIFGPSGVKRFKEASDKRITNREKLNEIRSRVSEEYFPSLAKLPQWGSEDEEKRCHEIERIYKQIFDDIKGFLVRIFGYCFQIAGPSPCNYSIIGLGSISRQEATPYSDLEFAILVDDNNNIPTQEQRRFFRFLTYFIQVEICKLGETILPSVGIASLNDFYGKNREDDWFYDDVIPKGFSFDGMMPWACKTPLGRKEWRGLSEQEYVLAVDEMLKLQYVNPEAFIENVKTANVFSSVCHLFGDEKLTKKYENGLSVLLTQGDRKKSFQEQVLSMMQNLLETFCIDGVSIKDFGRQQDVKKEVYRLTSLLVEQLSKFFGIFGQSSWKCIQELREKKIFTEEGAKNLLSALSITTELRLECYQRQGRQKEALPTVPQVSFSAEDSTPRPFTTAIVRLYQSLVPLKSVVSQILTEVRKHQNSLNPEQLVLAVLQQVNFIDVSPMISATAYLRILQLPKAFVCLLSVKDVELDSARKVELSLVLAYCYRMVGMFQEAYEQCREIQALYTTTPDAVGISYVMTALILRMDAYVDQGLYQEAMKIHEQIQHLQESQELEENLLELKLEFLNSSAVLFIKMKHYNKAEGILRDIIDKVQGQRRCFFDYFMYSNNLAVILLNLDRLTEAKATLNNALKVASELYGENAAHPYFARCLTNLSEVHYQLRDIEKADHLIQLALIIYSQVHDNQLIEPGIVDALITKARIYQFYKQWDEMFNTLSRAKEIAEILYQDNPHQNVASIHFYLAVCEEERGMLSEAMSHYQVYLKIHESQRIESRQSGHDCDTANVLIRIANLGASCSYDASRRLSYIEKALEIEEIFHGKEASHGHLAICYGTLGYCLITANCESKGLEYLIKSMKIFEEINLDTKKVYGRVQLTIGKLLGEHSPNKAEKHLENAKRVLQKTLNNNCHVTLLQINSSLLKIFLQTHRIQDGLKLAQQQHHLIDTMLSESCPHSSQQLFQVFYLADFYEVAGRRSTAKEMYIDLIRRLEEKVDPTDSEKDDLMLLLWMTQQRLGEMYQSNELFTEAESMFQRIASLVQKTTSQRSFVKDARDITLWHMASVFTDTARYEEAKELLDKLTTMYENDPNSIDANIASSSFFLRGEMYRRSRCLGPALYDLEKSLKIAEQFRATTTHKTILTKANEVYYAKITNAIGLVYEQKNNLERALEYYLCCLSTAEGIPPTMDTATFHQNVADVLKKLDRLDEALMHYKKSLEIREMLHAEDPVREDIATVLYHISIVQFTKQRFKDASETLDTLLPLRKKLLKKDARASLQNYCAALILKGNCHIVRPGEAQQAKDIYEEAEKVLMRMTEGQLNLDYAVVISNIGYACVLQEKWKEAIPKLEKALVLKRKIYQDKITPDVAMAFRLLATALLKNQEFKRALPYFQKALKMFEVIQSADDETECVLNIALCYKGMKNPGGALKAFEKAGEMCVKKSMSDRMRFGVHIEIAETFTEEEYADKSKVLHHLEEAEAILKRIKQSETDEENLNELQAKILSLKVV